MTTRAEWSDEELAAIKNELNCILADQTFRSSKRCVALLRCLVEHALNDKLNGMKERTLGVEVFGRNILYDTSSDPVVRMTAIDIRKRLGQYYANSNGPHAVKIQLVRGTYLPEFEFGRESSSIEATVDETAEPCEPPASDAAPFQQPVTLSTPKFTTRRKWILWMLGAAVVLFTIARWNSLDTFFLERSRQYRMWEPLLNSKVPPLLCITDADSLVGEKDDRRVNAIVKVIESHELPAGEDFTKSIPVTPSIDVITSNDVTLWLGLHGQRDTLFRSSMITLYQLRQGPAVLIGGFENPWSMIMLSGLRYSLRIDPTTHNEWIADAKDPSKREWTIDAAASFGGSYNDYGIISRFQDRNTGNWILGISGLGLHGTKAASELITNSAYTNFLPDDLNAKENIQIVVKSEIIHGRISPPQVLSVYRW